MTRLGKRCRYRDSIETLADIWLPISGEGNDLCTLKWILYDTGLLVGWSGFFLSNAVKSKLSLIMNWFWLNLTSLVRFLFFGFSLPNESTRLWYFVDVKTETHQDWEICWMLILRPVKIGQKMSIPRLNWDSCWSWRYQKTTLKTKTNIKTIV